MAFKFVKSMLADNWMLLNGEGEGFGLKTFHLA